MLKSIVTGHSKGLGAAVAAALLARGIPVLGLSRGGDADLAARHPALLREAALDLADGAALSVWLGGGALAGFLADAGTAILINNAGTVQPVGPLGAQDGAALVRAIGLNVTAPLLLANAFATASAHCTDRRIAHISSGAGRGAYPGWSVYCASKAALDHHARAVALDANDTLRICSLAPGIIDTDMQAQIRATPLADFPLRDKFETLKREGALARPEDAAAQLVEFVLGARFGREAVTDLRSLS
jgi:benzil reductase ((S)-benzoin forming)